MAKLDPYLRSIERFSATGALLQSGQAIVMRFPTGDRNATQVTPHDQLVMMVREVAPPDAYAAIEDGRPARFDYESMGFRYTLSVTPRPGAWQVGIDGASAAAAAPPAPAPVAPRASGVRAPTPAPVAAIAPADDMEIERGQYDGPPTTSATAAPTSGSPLLDGITRAARGARATDVYLGSGVAPLQRIAGAVSAIGSPIDAATLSRELGILAPADARGAWTDGGGAATFVYGDGLGRVRVTLGRDQRGPAAALRLLPEEPPALDRLNLGAVGEWLTGPGLILVAGPSGAGKTVVIAGIVRALGDIGQRTVSLEHPIEVVQPGELVSQRAVGEHVTSFAHGIASAMAEGADAIVVGNSTTAETVLALVEAVAGGHLVVASVVAPTTNTALDRVLMPLSSDHRDAARAVLGPALLGVVRPVVSREGRRYEVVPGAQRS